MVISNDKLTVVWIKAELTHADPLLNRVPETSAYHIHIAHCVHLFQEPRVGGSSGDEPLRSRHGSSPDHHRNMPRRSLSRFQYVTFQAVGV